MLGKRVKRKPWSERQTGKKDGGDCVFSLFLGGGGGVWGKGLGSKWLAGSKGALLQSRTADIQYSADRGFLWDVSSHRYPKGLKGLPAWITL